MLFINKLFNSIACLLSFTNLQLVIPGRTWILLYLGRTVYKCLWACLALYVSSWRAFMMSIYGDSHFPHYVILVFFAHWLAAFLISLAKNLAKD